MRNFMKAVVLVAAIGGSVLLAPALSAGAQVYPPGPTITGPAAGTSSSSTSGTSSSSTSGTSSRLAFTGSDSISLLWIGLAALTGGGVLVVAARRRATIRAHGAP